MRLRKNVRIWIKQKPTQSLIITSPLQVLELSNTVVFVAGHRLINESRSGQFKVG